MLFEITKPVFFFPAAIGFPVLIATFAYLYNLIPRAVFLANEELAILDSPTASSKLVSLPLSILLTTHPLLISVSFLFEDHEIRRKWQLLKVLKYTQISNFHVVDSSFMKYVFHFYVLKSVARRHDVPVYVA